MGVIAGVVWFRKKRKAALLEDEWEDEDE